MAYSQELQIALEKAGAKPGDMVRITKGKRVFEGILMPRIESGDRNCAVLKLPNGYNIGIEYTKETKIERLGEGAKLEQFPLRPLAPNPSLPKLSLLATGGTIASRIDYRTGSVIPAFKTEEILFTVPELAEIANVSARPIRSMWSEDVRFEHYQLMAREAARELEQGARGVIILSGTDTMHYSSAALSFMLSNLPGPVVFVGAQRSSDRGSSDAPMNLICAARFATRADASGVFVCMHGSISDDFCSIHLGTKVRKLHTSRRDAFKSINAKPVAKVDFESGRIEMLGSVRMRSPDAKPVVKDRFEPKVGLVKLHTDFDPKVLEFYEKEGYKGLVIEGFALGHAPINEIDEFTKPNTAIRQTLERLAKKAVVVMTSQALFGRIDMNVYQTGRDLLRMGIIPGEDMMPEVAYVKLKWLLGNFDVETARRKMGENLAGEINPRITVDEFPV